LRSRPSAARDDRHDVEVRPPQRGGDHHAQYRRDYDARADRGSRADADRHDRLAQRDDHDRPVTLGEVARYELPTLDAEQKRPAEVEHQRQAPQPELQSAGGECRDEQQTHADRRAAGQAHHRMAQPRVLAAGNREQHDVRSAHRRVGAGEQQRLRAERARHTERRDEKRGHRREHRQPHQPLLRVNHARQPRVPAPRPPQHAEHEQPLEHPLPRRRAHDQRGALRQREHEHEVEEQLQRRHLLAVAHYRRQARAMAQLRCAAHRAIFASRHCAANAACGGSAVIRALASTPRCDSRAGRS